jgi:hypothetical protein
MLKHVIINHLSLMVMKSRQWCFYFTRQAKLMSSFPKKIIGDKHSRLFHQTADAKEKVLKQRYWA